MAQIAAAVAVISGTLLSYKGQKDAGAAARRAGTRENIARRFEADQLDQQSGQSIAAAQRQMLEERRQAMLAQSRARAVAASSGAGASDTTVMNLVANIAGQGAYRESVAMFEGFERAQQLRMGAKAKRYEGAVAEEGGIYREAAHKKLAAGSLLKGAGLLAKYGGGGPPGGDAALLDAGSADLYDVG